MKKLKSGGLIFLLGIFTGATLALFFRSINQPVPEAVETETTGKPARESGALLARIREQEDEIVRLRAEIDSSRPRDIRVERAETEPGPPPETERRPGFARQMEARMARRLDSMVADYGLNDTQRAQLEEVFNLQRENFRARRRGEDVNPFNLDDAVAGILSEEQFSEYLEESQEEIYNRAELIATTQLVRLSQSMDLSDEQQATIYDTVNETAQEWLIARQTGEDFNMRQVVEEHLGAILTDEQLSTYLESIQSGPGFGPPDGRPPPPGP